MPTRVTVSSNARGASAPVCASTNCDCSSSMSLQNIRRVVSSSRPVAGPFMRSPAFAFATDSRTRSRNSAGSVSITEPPSGGMMHDTNTRHCTRSGIRRAISATVSPPIE